MKFTLSLSVLLAVSAADCSVAPTQDVDLFMVFDHNEWEGHLEATRVSFAAGVWEAGSWVKSAGREFKGSYAALGPVSSQACWTQHALEESSLDLLQASMMNAKKSFVDGVKSPLYHGIVWAAQTVWASTRPTQRRVVMVATWATPTVSPQAEISFETRALVGGPDRMCPQAAHPTTTQWQTALRDSQAGLLVIVSSQYQTDANHQPTWASATQSLGDVIVPAKVLPAQITSTVTDSLKTLFCPTWIATTSTTTQAPQAQCWDQPTVTQCMNDYEPTQGCNWRKELIDCFQQ